MSQGKIAFGAVFGAIAGFVTGVLIAPKSGKETREDIKNVAATTKDSVVETAGKTKVTAEKKAQEAKAWGEDVVGDVSEKANDFKSRAERAIDGAKKGFSAEPNKKK
ncbi:MAG: YtxH domain-containing protein [Candidatus Saccharimonadaceae bacterium]